MENDRIEMLLKKIGSQQIPPDVENIAERQFSKFTDKLKEQKHINFREYFMRTKLIQISAAAVIILVAVLGIQLFRGTGQAVTLAAVYEKMMLVNAFMYKGSSVVTDNKQQGMLSGETKMESTVIISKDYGMKSESLGFNANTSRKIHQQIYILPQEKNLYWILPEQKQYMAIEFNHDLLERWSQKIDDPRDIIKKIMTCDYVRLGRKFLDDIEVEGFETTDPRFGTGEFELKFEKLRIVLWVDIKTQLPVRVEKNIVINEQMKIDSISENFKWDLLVDAREFEPVIPEDYKNVLPDGMKMPSFSEEEAVEGLKFYLEITGKYPKQLSAYLSQELTTMQDSDNPTEAALRLKDAMKQISEEGNAQKAMEMMKPIHSLAGFYMMLVQDKKEPVYYGDVVGPADANKVLLRWKTGDNEYRVIYGNLTAESVSADRLAELESQIPK